MDQLLRSVTGTIDLTVTDTSGNLLDTDSPPAIAVVDSSGAAVTSGTSTRVSAGLYQFTLAGSLLGVLDDYVATWTATIGGAAATFTTLFEIVGGFYFTVAEARAWKFQGGDLSSATKFPTADIIAARNRVEERWENECCMCWVPRGTRATYDGTSSQRLDLQDLPGSDQPRWTEGPVRPRKIVAVTMDGVAFTPDEIADIAVYPEGTLIRKTMGYWNAGWRNISILFERGYAQPSGDIKRACLRLLQRELVPGSLEDTVIAITNEQGTRSLSTANGPLRRPFGIPEVDSVFWTMGERVPGLA